MVMTMHTTATRMTAITTRMATTDTLPAGTVTIRCSSNHPNSVTANTLPGNFMLAASIPEHSTRQLIELANIVLRNNTGMRHAA